VLGTNAVIAHKGLWSGSSQFYHELAVQVVESCLLLSEQTGGLTDISIVKARISKLPSRRDITEYIFSYVKP